MADIGRSSFIPKEAVGLTPGRIRRRRTFHIFGFIATAMFIGSLALAGGVYFLKSTAENGLESAKQALNEQKSLFKPDNVNEIREFDRRLKVGEALIHNHVAPLKIFAALEEQTKQKVQLTSFKLEHSPSREILVSFEGVTPEFRSLALQEMQFGDGQVLKDVLFDQLSLVETEGGSASHMVTFSFEGTVDLEHVRYDGTPVFTEKPVAFIESNDTLSIKDDTPAVLGESITNEEI